MSNDQTAIGLRIGALQPGQRVEDAVYRVAAKDLRTTSNGSLYIHAVIADSSVEMAMVIANCL